MRILKAVANVKVVGDTQTHTQTDRQVKNNMPPVYIDGGIKKERKIVYE